MSVQCFAYTGKAVEMSSDTTGVIVVAIIKMYSSTPGRVLAAIGYVAKLLLLLLLKSSTCTLVQQGAF